MSSRTSRAGSATLRFLASRFTTRLVLGAWLVACGGESAGLSADDPPALSFSAEPETVVEGEPTTLTWTTRNADTCEASGDWSGVRPARGNESVIPQGSAASYALECTGPGGQISAAVTVVVEAPTAGSLFPLSVKAGTRHLLDARGRPFLIHGDTPWSLMVQLTREEADTYLEDRRARGFNAVLVNLLEHAFADNPPNNAYGEGPFLVRGDFSTPNAAYFDHAEQVLRKAADEGMVVFLTPAYMGYQGGDQGWYQEMLAAGEATLRAYGRFLGNRFRGLDNIVWVHGGDYDPPNRTVLRAVAEGILDVQPQSLHTFHGSRGTAALEFLGAGETWLNVNNIYTNVSSVVSSALDEYDRSDMPFFFIEGQYEGEGADAQEVRLQAYQAVLSGACGQFMGNYPIWPLESGWESALNSPGSRSMTHLRHLLGSLAWWEMEPDTSGSLLIGGVGTGKDRATGGIAADGSFAVVYVPTRRDVTLALGALSGPNVRARWFDPSSGSFAGVPGSPFPASGSVSLQAPRNNDGGFGDWVLVLESGS